ncbi:MAG: hypothetical protein H0X42_05350 [Solirubrobacterales bacterium]|nr:hypothetical protein [Solirubrobacterales bacterium]
MSDTHPTHAVPLEAGAGPDNPPCPACGEPLFGWLAARPYLRGPVSRCESCGLGVVGSSGGPEEALRELDRLAASGSLRIVNRASFACSLGGAGWAGLGPEAHYLFTVEAVRRLVSDRDQIVRWRRWAPLAGLAVTWQTLLNSVTLGHNAASDALGRDQGTLAKERWQRRIDILASVVLATPALLVAIPVELGGGLIGRGAVVSLRFELL